MALKYAPTTTIEIFLRVRPTAHPSPGLSLDTEEGVVHFNVPKDQALG